MPRSRYNTSIADGMRQFKRFFRNVDGRELPDLDDLKKAAISRAEGGQLQALVGPPLGLALWVPRLSSGRIL